jgi:response regulator NasT
MQHFSSDQSADTVPYPKVERVLVADDQHLAAMELTLALSEAGYTTVGPAADGEAAVKLAETARPDIAVLDIQMPKKNGLEAARILFEEFDIPVVIVSAYAEREYTEDAQLAGVFGYVIKPASRDQLRVAIEVAWARYQDYRAEQEMADDLHRRLEERKAVERAKWILVSQRGMTEPQAMQTLQKMARDTRRKLIHVAREILGEPPEGLEEQPLPGRPSR